MKRPKFVRVIGTPPRAGTANRFRREGDMLATGSIVPVEWFETTPDAVFFQLLNPVEFGGYGILEEVEPGTAELAWLRDQYPAAFESDVKNGSSTEIGQRFEITTAPQETKKTRNNKQEEGE